MSGRRNRVHGNSISMTTTTKRIIESRAKQIVSFLQFKMYNIFVCLILYRVCHQAKEFMCK